MKRFLTFFLRHSAPGAQLWFYPHIYLLAIHRGLLPRLPWRTWVGPSDDQQWRRHGCLDRGDSQVTRCAGKPVAMGRRDATLLGVFSSFWQLVFEALPSLGSFSIAQGPGLVRGEKEAT